MVRPIVRTGGRPVAALTPIPTAVAMHTVTPADVTHLLHQGLARRHGLDSCRRGDGYRVGARRRHEERQSDRPDRKSNDFCNPHFLLHCVAFDAPLRRPRVAHRTLVNKARRKLICLNVRQFAVHLSARCHPYKNLVNKEHLRCCAAFPRRSVFVRFCQPLSAPTTRTMASVSTLSSSGAMVKAGVR